MPPASTNNEAALLLKLQELTGGVDAEASDDTWLESLVVTSAEPLACENPDDDLKRELAFYNQALAAVRVAQGRFERMGVPHARPDDYFAEMLKSDRHMTKVKQRMIQEQTEMQAAEERRKQRANKKFGKQVQREVLTARAQKRKREINEVSNLRKKSKKGGGSDFDIDVADMGGGGSGGGARGGGGGKGGGGKGFGKGQGNLSKREYADARFGKAAKRGNKRNTSESSAADVRGGFGRGGGGGKGGGRGGAGGKGGRGIAKKPRPGKERRKGAR